MYEQRAIGALGGRAHRGCAARSRTRWTLVGGWLAGGRFARASLARGVPLMGILLTTALWLVGLLISVVGTLERSLRRVADTAMLNTLLLCVAVTSHIGRLAFGGGG